MIQAVFQVVSLRRAVGINKLFPVKESLGALTTVCTCVCSICTMLRINAPIPTWSGKRDLRLLEVVDPSACMIGGPV